MKTLFFRKWSNFNQGSWVFSNMAFCLIDDHYYHWSWDKLSRNVVEIFWEIFKILILGYFGLPKWITIFLKNSIFSTSNPLRYFTPGNWCLVIDASMTKFWRIYANVYFCRYLIGPISAKFVNIPGLAFIKSCLSKPSLTP